MMNYFRDFIVSPINKNLQNIQNFFKTTIGSNTPAHLSQNHQDGSKRNIVVRLIGSIVLMVMLAIAVLWRPIKALFKMFTKNPDSSPVNSEEADTLDTLDTRTTESSGSETNPAVSETSKVEPPMTSAVAAAITPMRARRCGAAAAATARATEGQASPNYSMPEPR